MIKDKFAKGFKILQFVLDESIKLNQKIKSNEKNIEDFKKKIGQFSLYV
jgi:hypothetical protein